MDLETLKSLLTNDVTVTLLVCSVSLLAVLFPFYRGLMTGLQALSATRRIDAAEIEQSLRHGGTNDRSSITVQMLSVLQKSLRESERESCPTEFVVDASRQYVTNDYDAHYTQPISMCANILPPIGFIGTTGGLFVLFLSMRVSSGSLELAALATALTSSIFALVCFAILEGLKFQLYRRMLDRLDEAVAFAAHAPLPEPEAKAPSQPARPQPSHA